MPDRFYVSESSGYTIGPGGGTSGNATAIVSVGVVDREHLHRDVRVFRSSDYTKEFPPHALGALGARQRSRALCRELNADPELQYEPAVCTFFEEPSELGEAIVRAAEWMDS